MSVVRLVVLSEDKMVEMMAAWLVGEMDEMTVVLTVFQWVVLSVGQMV